MCKSAWGLLQGRPHEDIAACVLCALQGQRLVNSLQIEHITAVPRSGNVGELFRFEIGQLFLSQIQDPVSPRER